MGFYLSYSTSVEIGGRFSVDDDRKETDMKMQTKVLIGVVILVVLLSIGEIFLAGHFGHQFAAQQGN